MRKKLMAVLCVFMMLGVSLLSGCGKDSKEIGGTVESSSGDSGSTEGNFSDTTIEADVSDDALYFITVEELKTDAVSTFLMECIEAEIILVALSLEDPNFGDLNAALTMANMLFFDEDAPDSWLKAVDNYKVRDCLSHYFDGEFETFEQQGEQIISDEMAELAGLPSGENYVTHTVTDYDTEYVNIHFNEGLKSVSLAFNTPIYGNQQIRNFWNNGGEISYGVKYGLTSLSSTNNQGFYYYADTDAKLGLTVYFHFVLNDVETSDCKLAFVLEKDEKNPDKWLICGVYPIEENGEVQAPADIISTVFENPSNSVIPSLMIYDVSSFNMSNGVLTIDTGDDKFSLPVADNCTWIRQNGIEEEAAKETLSYKAFIEEAELMRSLLESYDYTPLGGLLSFSLVDGKVSEVSVEYIEAFDSAVLAERLASEAAEKEQALQSAQNTEGMLGDALNAYLSIDAGAMGMEGYFVLFDLEASSIPFLANYNTGDDGIYHYENGEIVCLLSNWIEGVSVNSSSNIISISGGYGYVYYEYKDGVFQHIDEGSDVMEEYQCEHVSGWINGWYAMSIEDAVAAYQSQN